MRATDASLAEDPAEWIDDAIFELGCRFVGVDQPEDKEQLRELGMYLCQLCTVLAQQRDLKDPCPLLGATTDSPSPQTPIGWPPLGWKTRFYPVEDTHVAMVQWFDWATDPLVSPLQFAESTKSVNAAPSDWVDDAHRLVNFVARTEGCDAPLKPQIRWTTQRAIDELLALRQWTLETRKTQQIADETSQTSHQQRNRPETSDVATSSETYAMKRSGANFHVAFEGESGDLPADLLGVWYLYWLLQAPNKRHSCTDLRNRYAAERIEKTTAASEDSVDPEFIESQAGTTLEDTKEEIHHLQERASDIEKAMRLTDDPDENAKYMEELEAIADSVEALKGADGRPRIREGRGADRKSVCRAIRLVIDHCHEKWAMPAFSTHLNASIDLGESISYRPADSPPDWEF